MDDVKSKDLKQFNRQSWTNFVDKLVAVTTTVRVFKPNDDNVVLVYDEEADAPYIGKERNFRQYDKEACLIWAGKVGEMPANRKEWFKELLHSRFKNKRYRRSLKSQKKSEKSLDKQ